MFYEQEDYVIPEQLELAQYGGGMFSLDDGIYDELYYGEGVLSSVASFIKKGLQSALGKKIKEKAIEGATTAVLDTVKSGSEALVKKGVKTVKQKVMPSVLEEAKAPAVLEESIKSTSRDRVNLIRKAMRKSGRQTSLDRDIAKLRKKYLGMGLQPTGTGSD